MSFSSFKKDQMIFENFRKFLNEKADPGKFNSKLFPTKLSNVDPDKAKVLSKSGVDSVDQGQQDDVIPTGHKPKGVAPVQKLKPSQSSMNIKKALAFVIAMLNPEHGLKAGGDLGAFISKDGYIMDGHHRWIATAMVDPSLSVGGYLVDFPGEQLVAILNTMTKGRFGEMTGKPATGGFEQFKEEPIRKQLQIYLQKGIWGQSPQLVQALIEKWTGQKGEAAPEAAVKKIVQNLSGITMSTPSWAPTRPDMPVIDEPNVPAAVKALSQGEMDVNPPYSKATKGAATTKAMHGARPVKGGRMQEAKLRQTIKRILKEEINKREK